MSVIRRTEKSNKKPAPAISKIANHTQVHIYGDYLPQNIWRLSPLLTAPLNLLGNVEAVAVITFILFVECDLGLLSFNEANTGEARRGFADVTKELEKRFPNPDGIVKESDKKDFVKLFGEYLRVENVLQNYDEITSLQARQSVISPLHSNENPPAIMARS